MGQYDGSVQYIGHGADVEGNCHVLKLMHLWTNGNGGAMTAIVSSRSKNIRFPAP